MNSELVVLSIASALFLLLFLGIVFEVLKMERCAKACGIIMVSSILLLFAIIFTGFWINFFTKGTIWG